jgi:hypothetical protein
MKKTLKSIKSKYGMLNESYAWERQEGKPLPTLADVQEKYNAKSVNEQEAVSDSTVRSYHIDGFANQIDKLKLDFRRGNIDGAGFLSGVDAAVDQLKQANPGRF